MEQLEATQEGQDLKISLSCSRPLAPPCGGGGLRYKLFREPKLNLGCVPHRPDQVHQRDLSHHYAERSLRLDDVIMRLLAPVFMFYGWPEAAMGGSSAFIGG